MAQLNGVAVTKLPEPLDEFKAHANNMNHVRWQYKEILAEIAESNLLDDILSQIHGVPGTFNKLTSNLPEQIRNSAYALC